MVDVCPNSAIGVQIICERGATKAANVPDLDRNKFLVSKDTSMVGASWCSVVAGRPTLLGLTSWPPVVPCPALLACALPRSFSTTRASSRA